MKKKFLSITMGTVLLLSTVLTGCGGNGGSGDLPAPADQPAANTAETTAAPAEPCRRHGSSGCGKCHRQCF